LFQAIPSSCLKQHWVLDQLLLHEICLPKVYNKAVSKQAQNSMGSGTLPCSPQGK
jgi:hypothetical protein